MRQVMEIVLFSLVSFLPYLVFVLLAFRNSFRFSAAATAMLTGAFTLLLIGAGVCVAPGMPREYWILIQSVCGGLFLLFAAKDQFGKKMFTLLMVANDANLVLVLAAHVQRKVFPQAAPLQYHWSSSLIMLGGGILILAPMFLYIREICAQTISGKRRLKAWNYLWLIPLNFYAIWFVLFYYGNKRSPEFHASAQFVLITLLLFLNGVCVYLMVIQLIKEHRQREEAQEREYMLAMQQNQYEHLQDRIDEARRAKHDLRHHVHLASAYLNDGKLEELRAYLQSFSDDISTDDKLSYCGHYAVNALLSYFAAQAKKFNALYNVSVDIPAYINIADEALVIVIGNLLENAVAACRKEETPIINVYGRMDDTAVFLRVSNTCTRQAVKTRSGHYLSTKTNGQGMGLGSVESIARRYDGIMEVHQQDGMFTVSVMLTIPDVVQNKLGLVPSQRLMFICEISFQSIAWRFLCSEIPAQCPKGIQLHLRALPMGSQTDPW